MDRTTLASKVTSLDVSVSGDRQNTGHGLWDAWHPGFKRRGCIQAWLATDRRRCRSWGRRQSAPTLDRRCQHGRSPRTTIHSPDERPRGLAQRLATTLKVLSKRGRVERICWWTIEPWLLARSILLRAKIRGRIQICLPKERRSKAFSFLGKVVGDNTGCHAPVEVLKLSTLHPCPQFDLAMGVQAPSPCEFHDPSVLSSTFSLGAVRPRS